MFLDLQTDLYDPNSGQNNLRHSAKGSLVTYDDTHSLTGYEPNDTELNDTVSDELVYSRGPFAYITPSSDQDMDDTTLGKLLTEAHREYADYLSLEGVFVSPSSVSVASDRTVKLVAKSNIDPFSFGVRNAYSAHNQFAAITQAEKWSIERWNLWEKALELLRSEIVPAHRLGHCLMNREKWASQNAARKFLITNLKQLEQNKNVKFYKKNYGDSKWNFVKSINKILLRWRNYDNSRVLPSIRTWSSSRTRALWNFLEDYKNWKMK